MPQLIGCDAFDMFTAPLSADGSGAIIHDADCLAVYVALDKDDPAVHGSRSPSPSDWVVP